MAVSKLFLASLCCSLFVLHLVEADNRKQEEATLAVDSTPQIDCGSACKARCELASRQRMCNRACGTCCARCNCVPPGTSGNRDVCPCYASMTTHGGRLKCP